MKEQVVLITGSTGGLGSALAAGLAEKGYKIALHYHLDKNAAENLQSKLNNSKIFQADLTIENSAYKLIEDVYAHFGRIDIIINNAGVSFSGMSWKQTNEDWNNVLAVNATAAFLVNKFGIPYLRQQSWGRIINISSVVANRPLAGTSAYAASKAALEGLTKVQAIELARFGITANAIAPGYFDTGMINTVDESSLVKLISEIPVGRLGNARDLIECVLYLCNENSGYITGQVLQLNGGLYL